MQIRIKGYTFQLSEPFRAGTVITAGEAQALNDLRAENIQNNTRRLVAEAAAQLAAGKLIPAPVLAEIQAKLTAYDLSYQFGLKPTKARAGDIETEARQIARDRVEGALRRAQLEATEEELERLVSEQEALPAIQDEARARVAARRRALSEGLSDL